MKSEPTRESPSLEQRDGGMTLPELLVSMVMMGLIVTVLCSAIVVTLRQQDATEGRLNVARAEQSISLWMPADLTSADTVTTEPDASPCEAPVCAGGMFDLSQGSNVVMMSWRVDANSNGEGVETNVSYFFAPSDVVGTYEVRRIECTREYAGAVFSGWTCEGRVLLRELPGPPDDEWGNPMTFVPGVTRPTWVIRVSEPLAPEAVAGADANGPTADPTDPSQWKDANRVIVTIDGGGEYAGAGGGRNQISITAGGTAREDIAATNMLGAPSFVAAKSRCGGPITLVIDESQSIAGNINDVRFAVQEFVNALRGTPVQVQIITFTEFSRVLGAPGQWRKYFDMTDPVQANQLYTAINGIQNKGAGGEGHTNWEEALYRVTYRQDGSFVQSDLPHTVVFFTDGIPTYDRNTYKTAAPLNPGNPPGYPATTDPLFPFLNRSGWPSDAAYNYQAARYHQVAFNRAEWIASVLRTKTNFIGVGVGDFNPTTTSDWRFGPSAADRTAVKKKNKDILADLIVGDVITKSTASKVAIEGVLQGGEYINPDTANMYIPDWTLLPAALRAVALGQCAGTVTMQTRSAVKDASGTYPYLDRPVRYLAQKVTGPGPAFTPGAEQSKYLETNIQFTARTFDFEVKSGEYVDVELVPMDFSDLASKGYTTNRWECTTAGTPVTLQPITTANPGWNGFGLRVGANRAVSCTHFVNPPS